MGVSIRRSSRCEAPNAGDVWFTWRPMGIGQDVWHVASCTSRRSTSRPATVRSGGFSFGKIGPLLAAFALASGAAAWVAGFNPSSMVLASVPPAGDSLNFDDRFQPIPTRAPVNLSPRSLVQSWSSELELKLQHAKTELAQRLQSPDMQTAALEEPKPSAVRSCSAAAVASGRAQGRGTERCRGCRRFSSPLPPRRPSARCCKN